MRSKMTISSILLLGIDGGGTSCRARIRAGDGTILGEGRAGPANVRLGLDKAFAAVLAAALELQGRDYYDWMFQNEPGWAAFRDEDVSPGRSDIDRGE